MYNSMTLRDKYLEGDTFPVAEIQKKTPFKTRFENIAGQSNMQIGVRGSKHSWYKPYKDKSFCGIELHTKVLFCTSNTQRRK